MDGDGAPSSIHRKRFVHAYAPKGGDEDARGWRAFVKRSILDPLYVTDGSVIIMCWIKVVPDDEPINVPPSNIASHLGGLLDSMDGSDISFVIGGEDSLLTGRCSPPAHRSSRRSS
ncbi:unnamed protein product [Urochloa humidicola]